MTKKDKELIEIAGKTILKNHHIVKHTIGSAVRCKSGKIYSAINIRGCDYGVCAERIACGYAISQGSTGFESIVTVFSAYGNHFEVTVPCGNCRQFLVDYSPETKVILPVSERGVLSVRAIDLLPEAYISNFEPVEKKIAEYKK